MIRSVSILLTVFYLLHSTALAAPSKQFIEKCEMHPKSDKSLIFVEAENMCINGLIDSKIVFEHQNILHNHNVSNIYLNSGGGTEYGGYLLRRWLKEHPNVKINVTEGMKCVSACVLALTSTSNLVVHPNAFIGVHYVFKIDNSNNEATIVFDKLKTSRFFKTIDNGKTDIYEKYKKFLRDKDLYTANEIHSNQDIIWHKSRSHEQQLRKAIVTENIMEVGFNELSANW